MQCKDFDYNFIIYVQLLFRLLAKVIEEDEEVTKMSRVKNGLEVAARERVNPAPSSQQTPVTYHGPKHSHPSGEFVKQKPTVDLKRVVYIMMDLTCYVTYL